MKIENEYMLPETQQIINKIVAGAQVQVRHPKLIGLCGKARAGKDTVAKYLAETHEYHMVWFAAPIKNMLRVMSTLITWDHLYGDKKEEIIPQLGVSARWMMQTLGTEWGRKCVDENLWINIAKHDVKRSLNFCFDVVVSDVRFDNEADAIKELGGEIWLVNRDTTCYDVQHHISEAGVSEHLIDKVIDNSGTIQQLYKNIELAINKET